MDTSLLLIIIPTASTSAVVVIIITIIIILYVRQMRFMSILYNNDWMVQFKDIVIDEHNEATTSSSFRNSMVCTRGTWKGVKVAIKIINKDTSIPLSKPLRLEIKAMREVSHKNLTKFIGACHEAPDICILMESAPKGSLEDLLANNLLNLNWDFRYLLLKDICQGMIYLSKTVFKSHGRLKPSNCVIDNKWTLKITDYGLNLFKSNGKNNEGLVEDGLLHATIKRALLYTAPEILTTGITHPDQVENGTIEGDVYSYSLVMYELLTKEKAFSEFSKYMTVEEILSCLVGQKPVPKMVWQQDSNDVSNTQSSEYLRPNPPATDKDNTGYVELMKSCWSQHAEDRPTFTFILKQLNRLCSHKLSPGGRDVLSTNDELVKKLEHYSSNLEVIVAERTVKLNAEKEKMENLICRMLPKAIAEQLQQGQHVKAELFDCVTIYFSDIVGFTSIACTSTPLQVVDLLNDLYTCFDDIIDDYDVYKVETIGDAYMVVSGLPIRNGDKHAGEIASMSLHLLSEILNFKIRHLPEKKLQLRIGIHSGPCVAGVVGLKMPRYCLFGDTVNTASRMESGGYALKIHLSESTALILARLGGYQLELRGEQEVKGKGMMTTYWLKGKDGCSRSLPTDDMAVSISQHEFK